jgi:drug/metabolite transporter (DMT)-like permease
MNSTHVDLPLAMISSAAAILISIIGGGIWILWKKEHRRSKVYALIVTIAVAFIQLFFVQTLFWFLLERFDLIPAMTLYALQPLLIGMASYLYLLHRAKSA